MSQPRVVVLRAAGVNCEVETAHAWEVAGAAADVMHVNVLRESPDCLEDYDILTVPGGFSYGDDLSAGRILANQLRTRLGDRLHAFADQDRLILGICNGFQVLCKAGLLPDPADETQPATITRNDSGKYEDRWVQLRRIKDHSPFLAELDRYELPVAHGEGRVVAASEAAMAALSERGCVALVYTHSGSSPAGYPANPNGSMLDVAGLCDPSGRILGLMPHPERFIFPTQHPEWTSRTEARADGMSLFSSAVAAFK
jgi:phosphoribosylformylglycinamidine synthase